MKPDQNDLFAENRHLASELARAAESISTSTAIITRLTSELNESRARLAATNSMIAASNDPELAQKFAAANEQISELASERDGLRSDLARANNELARLSAAQADFDGRVCAKLLQLGVRDTAITLPPGDTSAGEKKGTLTERMLAAKAAQDAAMKDKKP